MLRVTGGEIHLRQPNSGATARRIFGHYPCGGLGPSASAARLVEKTRLGASRGAVFRVASTQSERTVLRSGIFHSRRKVEGCGSSTRDVFVSLSNPLLHPRCSCHFARGEVADPHFAGPAARATLVRWKISVAALEAFSNAGRRWIRASREVRRSELTSRDRWDDIFAALISVASPASCEGLLYAAFV
ncbi:hypothetical protein MRX96_000672 [Rhipicephalus microplus]